MKKPPAGATTSATCMKHLRATKCMKHLRATKCMKHLRATKCMKHLRMLPCTDPLRHCLNSPRHLPVSQRRSPAVTLGPIPPREKLKKPPVGATSSVPCMTHLRAEPMYGATSSAASSGSGSDTSSVTSGSNSGKRKIEINYKSQEQITFKKCKYILFYKI
ncbi:hypothetical protein AVEN_115950-1 [Araneus ventricosus]|uniref:Uncharacterized protein n=1 Tax=Araneus ventricosus TaxID=182803 RepID=A0A4Y2KXM6_ARAVE|nr:hypothetical protein AVEN_115950-1 [Araneus ventricosus]